jgi:hypothetical protein
MRRLVVLAAALAFYLALTWATVGLRPYTVSVCVAAVLLLAAITEHD